MIVEYDKRDRYGRIVGKVLVGDTDACLAQVTAGYAWHYKKYQREQSETDRLLYAEAERVAKEERRGLWHDPIAIPPWKFRASERDRR